MLGCVLISIMRSPVDKGDMQSYMETMVIDWAVQAWLKPTNAKEQNTLVVSQFGRARANQSVNGALRRVAKCEINIV